MYFVWIFYFEQKRNSLGHKLDTYIMLTMLNPDISYFVNSEDPDQLASADPHCFLLFFESMLLNCIVQFIWIKIGKGRTCVKH